MIPLAAHRCRLIALGVVDMVKGVPWATDKITAAMPAEEVPK